MATSVTVDEVVAHFKAIDDGYTARFREATKVVDGHTAALKRLQAADAQTGRGGTNARASAAKAAAAELKRAVKETADAEKAEAKAAAAAVKAAEKEKQAALNATAKEQAAAAKAAADAAKVQEEAAAKAVAAAEREAATRARISAMVDRSLAQQRNSGLQPAVNGRVGTTVPREPTKPLFIPPSYLNGDKEATAGASANAAAEREINYVLQDQAELKIRGVTADQADKQVLDDQLALLRYRATLIAAGRTEEEAALAVEEQRLRIEADRTKQQAGQTALLERQMRAQQGTIANKISGAGLVAGGLVGGLGAAEISHLNDRYIELSNSLKVAGVSASEFDQVQQHLFETANRNGTDINALADVFRSASLGAHALGLSQKDLLTITDAASNALRIQGVSSERARGALLQLGHAFESGRVNAREFNSLALNLYPLLQAAARGSDQFGGSVAKLRAEIVSGTVSSKDFAQAIIAGAQTLQGPAAKATLTTAQGFTSLTNALVVYFGEANQAQGVSAALGAALQALGQNLDTLIPAIAAIGTALTVGYITRMTQAAAATKGLGAAVLGAFGGPVGLAITAVGLAIAGTVVEVNDARTALAQAQAQYETLTGKLDDAGHAALGAAGGIKGVGTDALGAIPHVNNFAGAVGNLAQQLYNQARAARAARVESLQQQLGVSQQKELDLASRLPGGLPDNYRRGDLIGNAKIFLGNTANRFTNILSGGYQDADNRAAYRQQVINSRVLQKQIADAKSAPITPSDIPGGGTVDNPNQARIDKLQKEIDDLKKIEQGATGKRRQHIDAQIEKRQQQIDALANGASPAAATAGSYVPGVGRGKSAETTQREALQRERQFQDQLSQYQDQQLQAQEALTGDISKRADIEKQLADRELKRQIGDPSKGLAGDIDLQAQRNIDQGADPKVEQANAAKLKAAAQAAHDVQVQGIEQQKGFDLAKAQNDTDQRILQGKAQHLNNELALADTSAQRRKIELELLDNAEAQERARLQGIIATSPKDSPLAKDAQDQLGSLSDQFADQRAGVIRNTESSLEAYKRSLRATSDTISDFGVHALQDFNQELDSSISKALHLHGVFGEILNDLIDMAIKQELISPIANSGGFGSLLGSIGSLFGIGGAASGGAGVLGTGFDVGSIATDIPFAFANGGSGIIGGRPGVDQNVLSINNTPVAKVGAGELLSVVNPNLTSTNQRVASPAPSTSRPTQIVLHVQSNDYFDAKVHSISSAVAAETSVRVVRAAAPGIAQMGAQASPGVIQRKQTLGN